MLELLLVEDNLRLSEALKAGLDNTGEIHVVGLMTAGESALEYCLTNGAPQAILMDVALAGQMSGIDAAVAIRREFPRLLPSR